MKYKVFATHIAHKSLSLDTFSSVHVQLGVRNGGIYDILLVPPTQTEGADWAVKRGRGVATPNTDKR